MKHFNQASVSFRAAIFNVFQDLAARGMEQGLTVSCVSLNCCSFSTESLLLD